MQIDQTTFLGFSKLITSRCGIKLGENRKLMLQNRISSRIQELCLGSYRDYLAAVRNDGSGGELDALVDAVTTNYTLFFRDPAQFDHVHDNVVSILKQSRSNNATKRRVRIWSAACSTGEEAYTLAMTAKEAANSVGYSSQDIRILATDIATSVLKTAADARYRSASVEALPESKRKYFERSIDPSSSDPNQWVVSDCIREMVIFRKTNLCKPHLNVPDGIDIIFCRNVLLYFETAMQKRILKSCSGKLRPGGWLYVGACEPVRPMVPELNAVAPSIFQRPAAVDSRRNGFIRDSAKMLTR